MVLLSVDEADDVDENERDEAGLHGGSNEISCLRFGIRLPWRTNCETSKTNCEMA